MDKNTQGYSVIIPSYNRPEMLKRSLASVYAQTVRPSQIYLTIDEPKDAEKYAFLCDYDDSLQVTYTGGGFGGAKARNVGLDQVESEFVFFLDDDDEWLPNKIEEQIQLLERKTDCVAVTCSCLEEYGHKQRLVSRSENEVNRYVKVLNLAGGFSCFGMRRDGALRGIRLNEDLRSAQDYEFYLRVSQHGKCAVVEEPLVLFYQHSGLRITTSAVSHRRATLYKVLADNSNLFSASESRFFKAKVEILTAGDHENIARGIVQYSKGLCFLLLAGSYPSLSVRILWRGVRQVLSNCKQKYKK